jgi:hypothetical protein
MASRVLYHVENDNLSDDWGVFDTLAEAEAWVREMCIELAEANLVAGLGDPGTRFAGMARDAIVDELYAENIDSIEARPIKSIASSSPPNL